MTLSSQDPSPAFHHADLTNCDREPIHIPGSIQPHGVLLVIQENDLTIIQVSENAEELLGISSQDLLLSPLSTFLTKESCLSFSLEDSETTQLPALSPLCITTRSKNGSCSWDGILHRSQGLILLELEKAPERHVALTTHFTRQAKMSLSKIQNSGTLQDLFETTAREVKGLTGFDRVMVYRFNERGDGEVIAETKEERLEPFLGLHYPASDIPQQARALYEKNWLRLIPSVSYKPSPLVPAANPLLNEPLDLTFSVLRSVSSIHCEYLRNMGVKASMSVSMLRDGKLWGLIACHHYAADKFVPYEVRTVCEFMGQMISWQLSSKIESENSELRAVGKEYETELIASMSTEKNFALGLVANEKSMLALTQASGAVICYEGEIYLLGATPTLEQVKGLLAWLQKQNDDGPVFQTGSLIQQYPEAESFKDVASGMLSIPISKINQDFLIWFRPEVIQTVNWAGVPKKILEVLESGTKIKPRKSFALWKESVKFHSLPWTSLQITAAQDLKTFILDIIVRRASELKRMNAELSKAVRSRDDFLSIASHELKTPLTALHLQVQLMLKLAQRTPGDFPLETLLPKLEFAKEQVENLDQLIDNLMDVSLITAGKVRLNFEDEVNLTAILQEITQIHEAQFKMVNRELLSNIQSAVIGHWDTTRLGQIITNLITNALKYGGLKPVEVTLLADEKRAVLSVKDQGIGIAEDKIALIFERFERSVSEHQYNGMGLGLWITRQIVEAMGGNIIVKSEVGKGSEFIVRLPLHTESSSGVVLNPG